MNQALLTSSDQKHQFLLAVPSGSKPNRTVGATIKIVNQQPEASSLIDFASLYRSLQLKFTELNIEGTCVSDSRMFLLQRGNGALKQNAIIELNLEIALSEIQNLKKVSEKSISAITEYSLDSLNGNSLAFTDACFLKSNELYFLAVAEKTDSTYDDGEYCCAVLGRLNLANNQMTLQEIDCPFKPEGLWVETLEDRVQIFIVTDADDHNQLACLYSAIF